MMEAIAQFSREPSSSVEPAPAVCDLAVHSLKLEPFPHVVNKAFIEAQSYRELCRTFPTCPPQIGPTGFSLYWGDEAYQQLLDDEPAWQSLFNTFHSQRFIDWGRDQFAEIWQQDGCKVDFSKARYVPYCEDRIDKERGKLRRVEYEPHELWVRMDIHQGRMGYDRPVHLDHARRLVSMLIYLCDHSENEMTGGELLLHPKAKPEPSESDRITPQHNLMVAFPCSDRSFHSVSPITAQRAPRNYIQVHISSSVDVWPRKPAPAWRLRLGSLKRRLARVELPDSLVGL
jgi:hypothetical protein